MTTITVCLWYLRNDLLVTPQSEQEFLIATTFNYQTDKLRGK